MTKYSIVEIFYVLGVLLLPMFLFAQTPNSQDENRILFKEIVLNADAEEVWDKWTTKAGLESFFARTCNVELEVDGKYEILFFPDNEPGMRGAENVNILAFQPLKMLSFTWNSPPHLTTVRNHKQIVMLRFSEVGKGKTRLTLTETGWGTGGEWDKSYEYFDGAWDVVLKRLEYSIDRGAIDWENPPFIFSGKK